MQFIANDGYPKYINFSEQDIEIFIELLKEEYPYFKYPFLKKVKMDQLLEECYFEKSSEIFIDKFSQNTQLFEKQNIEDILEQYISIFENNNDYLLFLANYIFKKINPTEITKLTKELTPQEMSKIFKHYADKSYIKPEIFVIEESLKRKSFAIIKELHIKNKAKEYKQNMILGTKIKQSFIQIEDIDLMNGFDFEKMLGLLFKEMNYDTMVTKSSGDQGADLVLSKLGEKTVVQAKRYFNKVNNKAVQEVVASMKYYNATNGIVVTNNYFTKSAIELADANNIKLWDRDKLIEVLDIYKININQN